MDPVSKHGQAFIALHSGRTYRGLGTSFTACFKNDPDFPCWRAYSLCKVLKTLPRSNEKLPQIMSEAEFAKYTSRGYCTIRRSHRFWSGIFADQTIEQMLMRMLKTRGGLAHGRGITPSTQSKMVRILPQTTLLCASLESFCGTHVSTTDQHTDLRPTATARDGEHFIKFSSYLSTHSPFSYTGEYATKLVNIATGVVAPSSANADCAYPLGEEATARLTGTNYVDVKLRRNDKVGQLVQQLTVQKFVVIR